MIRVDRLTPNPPDPQLGTSATAIATTENHARRITRSVFIVLGAVLLSRMLGFLREWMVARQIGSGIATDAYYAAFTLPDFLNYLVASSALEVILVPIFSTYLADKREHETWYVFSTVVTFVTLLLCSLIVAGEIFAPQFVHMIVPGFSRAEMTQVIFLTRLMLPAQLFLCLGVVFCSAQVAHSHFLVPCLGAAVSNAGIVLCGWLLASRIGITGFAIGVVGGGFVGFFVLQIIGLKKLGVRFTPNANFRHPGFRMFLRLAIPFMLALSVVVTDDWMLRWFGSFLQPSSITWLTYAKMLARIPMNTIGYAVGLASFPHLARLHSEGKYEELNHTLNSAAKALIFLLAPASALAIALHSPIVYLVFSRTRLDGPTLTATASTLALFAIGILGFGVQGLLARGFYATRDTITPAVAGTAFTIASILVYWYFGRHWEHLGLAAASSCIITLFAVVMFALLARRTHNRECWALLRFAMKIVLASAACGAACYWLTIRIEPWIAWRSTRGALLLLFSVSLLGFGLYLALGMALGVCEVRDYLRKLHDWLRPARPLNNRGEPASIAIAGD